MNIIGRNVSVNNLDADLRLIHTDHDTWTDLTEQPYTRASRKCMTYCMTLRCVTC